MISRQVPHKGIESIIIGTGLNRSVHFGVSRISYYGLGDSWATHTLQGRSSVAYLN